MRVCLVNASDVTGGAARAAYRLHRCLLQSGIESRLRVGVKNGDDWTVIGPRSAAGKGLALVKPTLAALLTNTLRTGNTVLHSAAIFSGRLGKELNRSDADLVHLHWICGELLSIAEVGRLTKPVVWTLHDMWPFCGAEHYTDDFRWRDGYLRSNRPPTEGGVDLNRWVWRRKRRAWRKALTLVAPSQWLAQCVRESVLMSGWPVHVVPNPLDTDHWRAVPRDQARRALALEERGRLILVGAAGKVDDPRKGMDLLLAAVSDIRNRIPTARLVVFGRSEPRHPPQTGIPIRWLGPLHDDISLRLAYSAADLVVLPSRQDNLPNVGVEALSCGVPVVAFDTCGLPDIVAHRENGWLAEPFVPGSLATGIAWALESEARLLELSANARRSAETRFAYPVVAKKYLEIYEEALALSREKCSGG